ncbi:MAG: 50S ribosomal protein L19 [Candidatus Moranbacteria bacterium]|nr:50S ribosomal protein L19 [Candidatus Moranbacteria bacterium]
MQKVQQFNAKVRESSKRPDLKAGEIVKIHRKIKEGEKERIQIFEGIVIAIKGRQSSSPMVTIRRVSFGIGVEITIPLHSPAIAKIEVVKQAKIRRSKLYYLRNKGVRISKLKTKELDKFAAGEDANKKPAETSKEDTSKISENKEGVAEGKEEKKQ